MDFIEKTQPKPKKYVYVIEDTYKLEVGDFGKKLLYPTNQNELNNLLPHESAKLVGKSGKTVLYNQGSQLQLSYSVDLNQKPSVLHISFTKDPKNIDGLRSQQIELEEWGITFGIRWYLKCGQCGRSCGVLYLHPKDNLFCCRECGQFTYESCQINRNSMRGMVYYLAKMNKLMDKRVKIKRIYYRDDFTKKMVNLIKMYNKWGLKIDNGLKNLIEFHLLSSAGIDLQNI